MEDKNFNPVDSLNLIDSMLKQAKSAEKDKGADWIVWGWLLFITSITHYISIKLQWEYRGYVWMGFNVCAAILILYTVLRSVVFKRKSPVRTYTNLLVSRLTLAFFISLGVIFYGTAVTGLQSDGLVFGFLLQLYAFWMFIYAAAFRFSLFYWGAAINWAGAVFIFYSKEKLGAEVLLVHALCVGLGYIIPGHIAYKKFYRNK
ncbi:MAG: hypothetical protein EKK37_09985 [Sphingobacteriales bacterium]|nr:MAG: hypothetical protein EKK37_09985 [Sphingobacteriales bacterium]